MKADRIDHTNAALFERQLNAFFAARHDIYVEELTWRPPAVDGLERDPFDTPAATYLVVTDEDGLVAGSRLIPTSEPHLASEYFAETFNRAPLPREADIVEWTRGFIVAGRRERGACGSRPIAAQP
jgi:acyl-homoserine lactone synthase